MLSTEVYDRGMNQITNGMPIAFPDRRISALLDYAARHGLRCKSIDGAWHFYKGDSPYNDYIQTYKQPAHSLLVPRKGHAWRLLKKHVGRMKPACEVCGTWSATHESYGLQICNWPECENDAAYTYESQERKVTVTKFKVGDKVQTKLNKSWVAEVVAVKTAYILKHEGGVMESSVAWFDEELEPAKAKLTVEEAWAEVGAMMMDYVGDVAGHLEEGGYSNIRNRAYAILGGNGIEVGRQGTSLHEQVKSRLNSIIGRALERYQED